MVVWRLETVMDAQRKELELSKPNEKCGEEDRIAVFSYSNVSQVEEDGLDLFHESQGKKIGKELST